MRGNRLLMVVAFGLATVTFLLVHNYIQRRETELKRQLLKGREPVDVLIAVADIPERTTIDPSMVRVETRSSDAIQPHALVDADQAVGLITVVPIYQGEQVLDSKLSRPERAETLSMKTPQGKRAVTISIDQISGVGGFIHPGDHVDMLGLFSLPTPDGKQAVVTVTLLQSVPVLATGPQFSEAQSKQNPGPQEANSLTLALTPQETELVLFARAQGQLQLSLRPKADSAVVADLQPMTVDALMGLILGPTLAKAQQQPPPPPPPKERQVELYRGLKKEVVVLSNQSP